MSDACSPHAQIRMNIHIYAKFSDDIHIFDDPLDMIWSDSALITMTSESRRSFSELEKLKSSMDTQDIVIASGINSLGLNAADITRQLTWFCSNSRFLVLCDHAAMYQYGVTQPLNKAVIQEIMQTLQDNSGTKVPASGSRRSNSGRKKLAFPEKWDELYASWEAGQISSKEFCETAGLKKASFYNLITEYKSIQKERDEYMTRFGM